MLQICEILANAACNEYTSIYASLNLSKTSHVLQTFFLKLSEEWLTMLGLE